MLVLGIALLVALLVPLVTRGSYERLLNTRLRWGWLLAAGLTIQIVLEFASPPRRYWHNLGYGLLVASYVLVLAFCARNVVLRGMSIVLIGIACNAAVIIANQGMPVKIPPEWRNEPWAEATLKHHPQQPGEQLLVLSDIIVVREPFDNVLSFGDLILVVGLCDVFYNASRDPQRRRKKVRRKLEAQTAALSTGPTTNGNGAPPASAPVRPREAPV
jgi:hypothetical protein